MSERRFHARDLRVQAAEAEFARPVPQQLNNGEESDHPYIANFSKGLPHDGNGEVDPAAYRLLLRALHTGRPEDFERVPLGGDRKLVNPQSGLGFDLQGPDPQAVTVPPAPRVDSAWHSAEAVELYWMALLRDVPFTDFGRSDLAEEAAAELSRLSDFRGPRQGGTVTWATLFRGDTRGDLAGPYLSQFLLRDIRYGTLLIPQRLDTLEHPKDHLTDFGSWLAVQNGCRPADDKRNFEDRRYIRTPRELAHYVHFDALYQAYLNACLILLDSGAPVDAGNPYAFSGNQEGFGTYGGPHVLSLVTEVATRALKAVWYQKWYVHRRQRPEEFGGRLHLHLSGRREYPLDEEVLGSAAVKRVHDVTGSYLLPQAFPEGSPVHPAYGAGHATVAGACTTVLKAWFDESHVLADPVVPSADGLRLEPYAGDDSGRLTVGGELNKLAANIAIGRNMGGVHWRSDYSASVRLGEEIAMGVLREVKRSTREDASFSLSRFDGTTTTL
ncbi:vanadium-dependent haloperoxidase [Streptomyces sp. TRM 70361]|uniref:vanadium-dependent haloperoxidase n=1 Tax=Streptomyces sp. TRM 70361 TaxID=3116553 RepID=UPI002E7C15B6|nr:vanadium-dependent haloperoxidase [Streptomyces sp. TRM 70361]MEE1939097.1 vanadium-dependent haloperoxidase [Streptomyces sp. TRM 70361]